MEEQNLNEMLLVRREKLKELVEAGKDPHEIEKFEDTVYSKDIKDNVIFAGKSPWEDVPCYYDMADVFVTASKSETQGLTVLEALASSTPVVCANDPSYIDAILPGTNGYVFDTEEEYIKNIKKLKKEYTYINFLSSIFPNFPLNSFSEKNSIVALFLLTTT